MKKILLFATLYFVFFASITNAEITKPLYTIDYKSQVQFGDSVTVGSYTGLENYVADYIGDYLHISYTITHSSGSWANYPPVLYIRSDDPSIFENTNNISSSIASMINNYSNIPTDVYFVDIQFSSTGYREIITRGLNHTAHSDDTVLIPNMDADTFIALANDYPSDPPNQYSMSFQPMRLESLPPTKVLSFEVSTSTNKVTVHNYIRPDDVGVAINFNISNTSGSFYVADPVYSTTTGDFYYTWTYPTLKETATGFEDYTFHTDISSSSIMRSKSVTLNTETPIIGYPGYLSSNYDSSEQIASSYNHLIQTLGTNLSGTLKRIDIKTSNPSAVYYGSAPYINLYECDDSTYGDPNMNGNGCTDIFNNLSDENSRLVIGTQIFYVTTPVVFNPSKYYFFSTQGNNQYNSLTKYYGSSTDTVDGGCFQYRLSQTFQVAPCETVSDLYFRLYGISKQITPPTPTGYSNVLFIPGLEASRLYAPDYKGGTDKLWEPNGNEELTRKLLMNLDGTAVRDDIYTKDVIDNAYVPLSSKGDVYKSFLEDLKRWKETDHIIADYAITPYDWRLSLDDILSRGNATSEGRIYYSGTKGATSTPYIIQELRRLAGSSRTGKVTIITHSNGGLVAKALTDKLGAEASELIDKIIFVAVPQAGTPKAIGALLHGFDQALPIKAASSVGISESTARALGQNMPSAYNLLPSANYFTYVDDPVVTFSSDPLLATWRAKYGAEIHSDERLKNFLVDSARLTLPVSDEIKMPTVLNAELLNKAELLHNSSLDNWTPPQGISVTEIAGWGEDTLMTIGYYQGSMTWCSVPGDLHTCRDFPSLEHKLIETVDGDGTVVVPSALWTATSTGVAKYWVNLREYGGTGLGTTINRKHADIFEIPSLRLLARNVITNSTSTPLDFISVVAPRYTGDKPRLRFLLHSPLDISATDNIGNIISSTTSTIPGSRFTRYGEVQVLTVPKNTPITLNLDGYATGSFTLDMEETDGNNTIIASSTFSAVPTATSTRAVIQFTDGTLQNASPLLVDYMGDGNTKFTLTPKIGEVVTFDTTPPEATVSFSTITQNIIVSGIDETSGTTVVNTATTSLISDEVGNTLKVLLSKSKEEKKEVKLQINRLIYNDISASNTPKTLLKYEWSNDKLGKIKEFEEEITIGTLTVKGHYDVKNNVTIIERIVRKDIKEDGDNEREDKNVKNDDTLKLNKSEKKTKETRTGLVVIGVRTNKGIISESY